jgi:monofunctional biosynthetic peptidoglycan transglycosylase
MDRVLRGPRLKRRPAWRRRRLRRRPDLRWTLATIAGAIVMATVLLVLPLRWLPPLTSAFMIRTWVLKPGDAGALLYDWVPRSRISRLAASAVIASEDQKFLDHHGFDFGSIGEAISNGDGPTRGASTISQQVAKNLYLWPGRSWLRKGVEAYLTLWIELFWPKERILEVYLNIAQFGPTVFGVEAAARNYFGKPAAQLNREESALLAAVLPNPEHLRVSRPSAYVRQRQAWIIGQALRVERVGLFNAQRWRER